MVGFGWSGPHSHYKMCHTPDYRVLREPLHELRGREGALQAGLAERLGAPLFHVSESENGGRRLDVVEVRPRCRALGLPFSAIRPRARRSVRSV